MIYGYVSGKIKYSFSQSSRILSLFPEVKIVEEKDIPLHSLIPTLNDGDKVVFVDVLGLCEDGVSDDYESVYADIYGVYQKVFVSGADVVILDSPNLDSQIFRSAILHNHTRDSSFVEMAVSEILEQQIRLQVKKKLSEYIGIQTNKSAIKKHTGNKKGMKYNSQKERPSKEFILKNHIDFGGVLTNEECIKELSIARNTFFKYKKELLSSIPSPIEIVEKAKEKVPLGVSETLSQPSPSVLKEEAGNGKGEDKKALKKAPTKSSKKKSKDRDEIEGQSSIFDFL